MPSEEYLRVGQGREKVTSEQLEHFLIEHNLKSLDDLPLCNICEKNHVHFRVKENVIYETCGKNGTCKASRKQIRNREQGKFQVGHSLCTQVELDEFLETFGLNSISERPRCSCGVPVYFNIKNLTLGTTCNKNGCGHDKRHEYCSVRSQRMAAEGTLAFQNLTEEQLQRRAQSTREANKRFWSTQSEEQKHEWSEKLRKGFTAEKRSKAASKSNKTRWAKGNHNFQLPKEKLSEVRRKGAYTRIKNGTLSCIISKIETECFTFLKESLDNQMVQQYHIKGLDHPFDMYSPKYNLIIEFDGDYWHKDRKAKDARFSEIALNNGYLIYRIPEWQYRENRNEVLELIRRYIKDAKR